MAPKGQGSKPHPMIIGSRTFTNVQARISSDPPSVGQPPPPPLRKPPTAPPGSKPAGPPSVSLPASGMYTLPFCTSSTCIPVCILCLFWILFIYIYIYIYAIMTKGLVKLIHSCSAATVTGQIYIHVYN